MKIFAASLIALGTLCVPASVEAQSRTFLEECEQYEVTETYTPGTLSHGTYSRGSVNYVRNRVPCQGSYQPVHHYPQPYNHYPQQYQQPSGYHQAQQPIVIQQAQCEGKILRMGLGALGGGFAGRAVVGGKKSNKTVLGTTLGAVAGSFIGRATC